MLYTEDLTMRHYVGFLQIGSHITVGGKFSLYKIFVIFVIRCSILLLYQLS